MEISLRKEQKRISDKTIDDLSTKIDQLSEELENNHKIIEESSNLFESLQELEQQNDNLQKIVEANKFNSETYESSINVLQLEINELQSENKKLQNDLLSSRSLQNDHLERATQLTDSYDALEKEFKIKQKLCHCDKSESVEQNYRNRLLKCETDLKQKHMDMQKFRRSASEDRRKLMDDNFQLKEMNDKLQEKNAQITLALDKHEKELIQNKHKLKEISQFEADLTAELNSKTDEICRLTKENSELRLEIDELSTKLVHIQTANNLRECQMLKQLDRANKTSEDEYTAHKETDQKLRIMLHNNKVFREKNQEQEKKIKEMQEDACTHREQIATLEGREQILADILQRTQSDMSAMKEDLQKLTDSDQERINVKRSNELLTEKNLHYADDYNKLEIEFSKFRDKYQTISTDYEQLKTDFSNLLEIKDQAIKTIETTQKWQQEQRERENMINIKFGKQNEHIRTLLEEREHFVTKINQMTQDYIVVRSELERFQSRYPAGSRRETGDSLYLPNNSYFSTSQTPNIRYRSAPTLNESDHMLLQVKHWTRQLHTKRLHWQNGMHEANRK